MPSTSRLGAVSSFSYRGRGQRSASSAYAFNGGAPPKILQSGGGLGRDLGLQLREGILTPPTLEIRKQKEVALVWALLASTTTRPWSSMSAKYRPVVTCRMRSGWPQRRWLPLQLQRVRTRVRSEAPQFSHGHHSLG